MLPLMHRSRSPRRRERGAVALEYALVLPLFLAAVFCLFELGFTFIAQGLLDNAVHHAARLMRIGTLSGSGSDYGSRLVTTICNDFVIGGYSYVPSCKTKIQIYVTATSAGTPSGRGFSTLKTAQISGNVMTHRKSYVGPKYDVVMQVGYAFPWAVVFASGDALLVSTLAFQTEPY